MITYEYCGFFLEMSLVGEQSSIRIKGIVPTHSHITFYDTDISRMKSQFESFVDGQLKPIREEEDESDIYEMSCRGHALWIERDFTTKKIIGGYAYNLYETHMFAPLYRVKGNLKQVQEQFEKYVDGYYTSVNEKTQ